LRVIYVFKIATVESESSIQNNAYLSSPLVRMSQLRSCINYFRLYSDLDVWWLCILRTTGSFLGLKLFIHESTQLRCASLDKERTVSRSFSVCQGHPDLRTTFSLLCFRLDEEETIATFSIGYADGYSRQLSGKGVVTTVDGETTGLSLSGFSVFFTDYSVAFYQFYFHYYSLSGFIVFFTDYSVVLSVFFSQLLLVS